MALVLVPALCLLSDAPTGVRVTAAPGTSPQAGESVTLTCSYTSSLPAPNSYTWYRGDQQLEGSRREMVLKSITVEQAGEYRCQANNGIGQSRSPPITITVRYAPTGVHVTAAPGTSPQAGESVTLTCSYTRSLPAPNSYTWYRGGRQLEGSRREMVLKSITVEQAGEYRCKADNGIGQSPSPPINITVLSTPLVQAAAYILGPAEQEVLGARTPGAPNEVCPGSLDSTGESHIYSQPMNTGKVPQSDPDEVHYAAVQLQPLTRRAEPVADLTCEYAVIKS
ncbi:unnamed protein product [Lepidochelys kempii]